MRKRKVIILIGLLILKTSIFGQAYSEKLYSISLMGGLGSVFETNALIKGNTGFSYPVVYSNRKGVKVQKRLSSKPWHSSFNFPKVGFQIFKTKFKNGDLKFKDEIGQPIVISGFYDAPFIQKDKYSFGYYLGLGAAIGWKPFSQNGINISIGSKTSFYIELGINLRRKVLKNLELNLDLGLTHYSNGATKLPNFGINIGNTVIGLNYNFGKELALNKQEHKEAIVKKLLYDFSFFAASKSTLLSLDTIGSEKYNFNTKTLPVIGVSATVSKNLNRQNKMGVGLALTNNSANSIVIEQIIKDNGEISSSKKPKTNLQLSSYLAYELKVGQVSILVQPSFYIYRGIKLDYIPNFYQRLGVRYNTKKKAFIGFNLRAYDFHISDFIEWNIGYSF